MAVPHLAAPNPETVQSTPDAQHCLPRPPTESSPCCRCQSWRRPSLRFRAPQAPVPTCDPRLKASRGKSTRPVLDRAPGLLATWPFSGQHLAPGGGTPRFRLNLVARIDNSRISRADLICHSGVPYIPIKSLCSGCVRAISLVGMVCMELKLWS